jgi:hypothetical protein
VKFSCRPKTYYYYYYYYAHACNRVLCNPFCLVVVVAYGYAMLYSNSGGNNEAVAHQPQMIFLFSFTVGVFFRVTAAAAAARLAVHRKDSRVK